MILTSYFRHRPTSTQLIGRQIIMALGMMIWLSLKLRRREFEISHQIGGDRSAMVRLVGAELALLLGAGSALCVGLLMLIEIYGAELVRALLFGG